MKQAFGNETMGHTLTFEWFKCFRNGRTSTDDDIHSGHPSTGVTDANIAEVCEKIHENYW